MEPSINGAASPSPSETTIWEESEVQTQLLTLHCHSDAWRQFVEYKRSLNWPQVPEDLQNIIQSLINWDCCPCGVSEATPSSSLTLSASNSVVPASIEDRLSKIEDSINTIAASINTTTSSQSPVTRETPQKFVLVSPTQMELSRAIELVHLAVPGCKAKVKGVRGIAHNISSSKGTQG